VDLAPEARRIAMIAVLLLVALLLLLLNAFFVLAEFAAVKMRPTRVEELVRAGEERAVLLRHVQDHLDEYLSVCQVGITLASIGLGFVGEPAFARLIEPLVAWTGTVSTAVAHSLAIGFAYVIISFLHIVLGELVPKSIAIRGAEQAGLFAARPLRLFHRVFFLPLTVLNGAANWVLRWLGYPASPVDSGPSERELKIALSGLQSEGRISFERVLLLENVFDLASLSVKDEMRPRDQVRSLRLDMPWSEVDQVVQQTRYSRYPVLDASDQVTGVVHVKDLLYESLGRGLETRLDLSELARPCLSVGPDMPLEQILRELQRARSHAAMVVDTSGRWIGWITLEDVLEEIVGTIEDEFEREPPCFLEDALCAERIVLDFDASSIRDAIAAAIAAIDPLALPARAEEIVRLAQEREDAMSTYLGSAVALPHARLSGIESSVLVFARSLSGVPIASAHERAHFFFILLTPVGRPREHVRLAARVAHLFESEFIAERLRLARSRGEILDIIREGDLKR
jgi:CBS domain containing-hemolysin-like protein/mannitol/fructose-specific phosphotransferase system IIA component (Ntr-type)